jgi:NOL1/NOP2/sun family putative RNA methylase
MAATSLSTSLQFPPDFTDRLQELYPSNWAEVITVLSQPRATTFRVNTLKTTVDQLAFDLHQAGVVAEPIPAIPGAWELLSPTLRELTELPLYIQGHLYVQGLSSQVPPLVLQPQPEESILDVAAAPGSKTTQMAALMRDTGRIIANDTSHIRLYKLKANLETQGVHNTMVIQGPGQILWQRFGPVFDRVLVDVPCSMEGRFRLDQPKTWDDWSVKKVRELADRQKLLLRSALGAAEPGGTVVYSTCTLAPEENEAVIDWLLHKEAGQVAIEPVVFPGLPTETPCLSWQGHTYHSEVKHTIRIKPSRLWEGFFLAKLRKLG